MKKTASLHPDTLIAARVKLGEYLRGIREHRGLSQRALAEKAGITQGQVTSVEKGSTAYTIDTFLAVTSALDCYFFLADREGKHLDHQHLVKKTRDPI